MRTIVKLAPWISSHNGHVFSRVDSYGEVVSEVWLNYRSKRWWFAFNHGSSSDGVASGSREQALFLCDVEASIFGYLIEDPFMIPFFM